MPPTSARACRLVCLIFRNARRRSPLLTQRRRCTRPLSTSPASSGIHSDLEIGVFTPSKKLQKVRQQAGGQDQEPGAVLRGRQGSPGALLDFEVPGIKVVNYPKRAKGLEFDVVFIPELQR